MTWIFFLLTIFLIILWHLLQSLWPLLRIYVHNKLIWEKNVFRTWFCSQLSTKLKSERNGITLELNYTVNTWWTRIKICKVNIKRRRTGNRKRKLYGYFPPSKATLLFLLYSAFLILLFLFKRKKQAKIIYNHRLSVSTVHLFSLTTAECVRVFVFGERRAGTIMYQWNNIMYKTRILFSNKFYCLCYNPAWKCS